MKELRIQNKKEAQLLIQLASDIGELLLENGAEIYRIEDTATRICDCFENIESVNVFVTYSTVIISLDFEGEVITSMKRIMTSTNNLSKIVQLNDFSRKFVKGEFTIAEGMEFANNIQHIHPTYYALRIAGLSIAAASFCLLFGGGISEALATLPIVVTEMGVTYLTQRKRLTFFLQYFFTSLIAASMACLIVKFNMGMSLDSILIGLIMPMVPGVSMTNATRDLMSGDLLSGLTGMVLAMLIAVAIALGVGLALQLHIKGVI